MPYKTQKIKIERKWDSHNQKPMFLSGIHAIPKVLTESLQISN